MGNPLWGAARIHGELLKVAVDVSWATVAKYMTVVTESLVRRWCH